MVPWIKKVPSDKSGCRKRVGEVVHTFSKPETVMDLAKGWLQFPVLPYTFTISEGPTKGANVTSTTTKVVGFPLHRSGLPIP